MIVVILNVLGVLTAIGGVIMMVTMPNAIATGGMVVIEAILLLAIAQALHALFRIADAVENGLKAIQTGRIVRPAEEGST